MDFVPSICTSCARGCNVTTGARQGEFLRMAPRENADVNKWWMCDTGRLDYHFVNSETRLAVPRVQGRPTARGRTSTWEDGDHGRRARRSRPRTGDVLLDGNLSLEEMHLAPCAGRGARREGPLRRRRPATTATTSSS